MQYFQQVLKDEDLIGDFINSVHHEDWYETDFSEDIQSLLFNEAYLQEKLL